MLNKYRFKRRVKDIGRLECDQYFTEYIAQTNFIFDPRFDNFGLNENSIDQNWSKIEQSEKLNKLNKMLDGDLVNSLQLLVLCDRYNKTEKSTEGMDFD
jgi:hypothetical protein